MLLRIGLLGPFPVFLHRELKANHQAQKALRGAIKTVDSDVKKLSAGDVAWVRSGTRAALRDRAVAR